MTELKAEEYHHDQLVSPDSRSPPGTLPEATRTLLAARGEWLSEWLSEAFDEEMMIVRDDKDVDGDVRWWTRNNYNNDTDNHDNDNYK